MVKYDDIGGVWRTIGGRRVFIKNGQDLKSAMKESGKFDHDDEYDRAHGVYKKEEQEINERNKKLHREMIEKENRIKLSNMQETNRHIKNATTQKSLKSMANAGYAKDITNNSFEANELLRKEHGKLEKVKTIKGIYGINGAILKSRETGEYFVITSRNSNIDYWI